MTSKIRTALLTLFWCLLLVLRGKAASTDQNWRDETFQKVATVLGGDSEASVEEISAADFLVQFMPAEDLGRVSIEYLVENVRYALKARTEYCEKWACSIPWVMFLNDVLPYASLTEPRDEWRERFFEFMSGIVKDCSNATCAALTLNEMAWSIVQPPIGFAAAKTNGLNSYSPFQTMRRHNSSCTGLAIFLVDSLRSVGIPARVAGTPHWNKGPSVCPNGDMDSPCGNHNWVELFADGVWHFVDQRGGTHRLDDGWFYPSDTGMQRHEPDSMNHSIYATSWAPPSLFIIIDEPTKKYAQFTPASHFPMVWAWDDHSVPAWETINLYHHHQRQPLQVQAET